MVLLSEYIVSGAAILILKLYLWQAFMQVEKLHRHWNRNHAGVLSISMIILYSATRVLLETETPQSVIPGFVVVVLVMTELLKRGKYYPDEMLLRVITVLVSSLSLLIFSFVKGFVFLSERAQQLPFDRELEWYHSFLIFFSSWRYFLIFVTVAIPVYKSKRGIILMAFKIVLVWVLWAGSGTSVAQSPWGALDEILLERNALLYLIFGLITFVMVTDQFAAIVVANIEERDKRNETKSEEVNWDDIKKVIFASLSRQRNPTSQSESSIGNDGNSGESNS